MDERTLFIAFIIRIPEMHIHNNGIGSHCSHIGNTCVDKKIQRGEQAIMRTTQKKRDKDKIQWTPIGLEYTKRNIKPGDKLKIMYKIESGKDVGKVKRTVVGKVISINKYFVRLDLGPYKESFCWWDVWRYGRKANQ